MGGCTPIGLLVNSTLVWTIDPTSYCFDVVTILAIMERLFGSGPGVFLLVPVLNVLMVVPPPLISSLESKLRPYTMLLYGMEGGASMHWESSPPCGISSTPYTLQQKMVTQRNTEEERARYRSVHYLWFEKLNFCYTHQSTLQCSVGSPWLKDSWSWCDLAGN